MRQCLLISTLARPEAVSTYALPEWDLLVRQARAAHLLARLFVVLERHGLTGLVPARPRLHLESAWAVAERQREAIRLEVAVLRRVLGDLGVPTLLLKGAAYVVADLPTAEGRTLSDIDILVPKRSLPDVEAALMRTGWMTTSSDPYDQRYYRGWMHEIPPLQHLKRGTVLDVHHAIVPESARIRADSEAMRAAAVPIAGAGDTFVLMPADMILHSATHLFHEGETDKALRDLMDLDGLMRHFATGHDAFWSELLDRARRVGLTRHLHYALRFTSRILGTPVPGDVIESTSPHAPMRPLGLLMDALYRRAFQPLHPSCGGSGAAAARAALYVRGHWLRMPATLLVRHLARKALMRNRDRDAPA